jgi:CRP/FNR family transcriptional regulator, cyclic AMP receptor protein
MQRTYRLQLEGPLNVPESTRDSLMSFGRLCQFSDGQFIMHQGEVGLGFFAVTKGKVMVGRHDENGTLTIYGVAGPGDLFGDVAFFADTPRISDAVADGDAEVMFFDGAAIKMILSSDPEITLLLLRSLAGQIRVTVARINAMRSLTVAGRLAQELLGMQVGESRSVDCTHQQLADLVGVSRVSLGAAFRELEATGAVSGSYGKVRIDDRSRLAAFIHAAGRKTAH